MIFGIGVDISKTERFVDWISDENKIRRFFNQDEIKLDFSSKNEMCQYYASRFAVKEAFGKALGTGIKGFALSDVCVVKQESGKPDIRVSGNAEKILQQLCGECKIHLSISHETDYAIAYVIIEK